MAVLILVALMAVLATAVYLFLARRYSTWKRKGVVGPPAAPSLFIPKVMRGEESFADRTDRVYREYRDAPVAGSYMFGNPILHVHDPDILKQVLIKEFQDFSGRGTTTNPDYDPMSAHLFFESGKRWKSLRQKLAPVFTSGKIKNMFLTIRKSSEQLTEYLDECIAAGGGSYTENNRLLMTRLFVDVTAQVAFGIDSNVVRHKDSPFMREALRAIAPSLQNAMRVNLSFFGHRLMRLFRVQANQPEAARFFRDVVGETVSYREKNDVVRADLLHHLIQLKNQGFVTPSKNVSPDEEGAGAGSNGVGPVDVEPLNMDQLSAEVFIFLIAGFESSSSTTSFTLWEMAKRPDILEKAVNEVDRVLEQFNGQITYEAIMSMPYLDKCVNETLRKYPPLPFLTRHAMTTRKVPLTDVKVEKGTVLVIPVRALHYDPEFYPNPELYDPERFSEEQKATRPSIVYLPFGEGPRICIAFRLGLVQIKTALVTLLSKYTVSLADKDKAPTKMPINPKSFATTPSVPINITFKPRTT